MDNKLTIVATCFECICGRRPALPVLLTYHGTEGTEGTEQEKERVCTLLCAMCNSALMCCTQL